MCNPPHDHPLTPHPIPPPPTTTPLSRAVSNLSQWIHTEHLTAADQDRHHHHLLELVQGCAGSCKTSYMLYRGLQFGEAACHPDTCRALQLGLSPGQSVNVLLLTKTGSVTAEIEGRLKVALGLPVQSFANHSVLEVSNTTESGVPILFRDSSVQPANSVSISANRSGNCSANHMVLTIANFDAWVHHQLHILHKQHPSVSIPVPEGDQFHQKLKTLSEWVNTVHCDCIYSKTGPSETSVAHYVAVDEYQDIPSPYIRILCAIQQNALRRNQDDANPCSPVRVRFVGDLLQTVSSDALTIQHPLHTVMEYPYAHQHQFHINHRCPRAHITCTNALMRPYQKHYTIQPMQADNTNDMDKPICFPHISVSASNENAYRVATQVTQMIDTFMHHDTDVQPGDIAVIMRKTNDNVVFEHLESMLQPVFQAHVRDTTPGRSYVRHMRTKYPSGRIPLQWTEETATQCVLLSICGDKGKHHKLVIALGLTERSIPLRTTVNKPSELCDQSHLNVLLTRSTKYLCIGFTQTFPSRYLHDCHHDDQRLEQLCYCPWSSSVPSIPHIYKQVIDTIHATSAVPFYSFPKLRPSNYPRTIATKMDDIDPLCVADIASQKTSHIPHIQHIWKSFPTTFQVHTFGTRVPFTRVFRMVLCVRSGAEYTPHVRVDEVLYECLGELCEWMLFRRHHPQSFQRRLMDILNCHSQGYLKYTDDEQVLSRQRDRRDWLSFVMNAQTQTRDTTGTTKNTTLTPCWAVHTAFRSAHQHLSAFFTHAPNHAIPFHQWWTVHLFCKALGMDSIGQNSHHHSYRTYWSRYATLFDVPQPFQHPTLLEQDVTQSIERVHYGVCNNIAQFYRTLCTVPTAPSSSTPSPHHHHPHHLDVAQPSLYLQYSCGLTLQVPSIDKRRLKAYGIQPTHYEWTEGFKCGVIGKCDLYQPDTHHLYELKASHFQNGVTHSWVVQMALYAALLLHYSQRPYASPSQRNDTRVKHLSMINVLEGRQYTYTLEPNAQLEGRMVIGETLRCIGYNEVCVHEVMHQNSWAIQAI